MVKLHGTKFYGKFDSFLYHNLHIYVSIFYLISLKRSAWNPVSVLGPDTECDVSIQRYATVT